MQSRRPSTIRTTLFFGLASGAALCAAFALTVSADSEAAEQSVNVASASAEPSPSPQSSETRKVRVIDMTAANVASSDTSRWYDRAAKPGAAKNAAKATAAPAKPEKTKKAVRRAPPREPDARSAYASAPNERQGCGSFFRE
jgi:hypothetical protein